MLDNFGLGEFMLLALFALIFFGPERLPRIGARLGRWLNRLTEYSKAFMTQWSEEALVIQEAVEEVRGIRDEIVAARAEIAGTLDTARQDIDETISDARGTLNAARPSARAILQEGQESQTSGAETTEGVQGTAEEGAGEEEAIAKTQQIVDDLVKKRSDSPAVEAGDEEAEEAEPGDAGTEGVESEDEGTEAADPEDEEWERNYQVIQEMMQRDAAREGAEEEEAQVEMEAAELHAAPQVQVDVSEPGQDTETEEERESAFDKTQRILDDLLKKRGEGEEELSTPIDDVRDRGRDEGEVQPAEPVAVASREEAADMTPSMDAGEPPAGQKDPEIWVSHNRFAQLSAQVSTLKNELQSLKRELEIFRTEMASPSPTRTEDDADRATEQVVTAETSAETEAAMPVEEVT
jgi:Sec-independent protein translocase protein TatA